MGNWKDLFGSEAYRDFIRKIGLWGLIVLALGVMFLILKWPGSGIMLALGGINVLLFALMFVIERISKRNDID